MYSFNDLIKVKKPGQYVGGELNSILKNPAGKLRIALAFPDLYEIGMSYTGLHILYELINREENLYAERVFAPWIDFEKVLREKRLPLLTLETKTPLNLMDIIGFTFQYELTYTNFLNMLDICDIPIKSEERKGFPLIMAGGPCVFNPEPLAPFIDVFYIGEAETKLGEVFNLIHKMKTQKASKNEILETLYNYPFLYIPKFSKTEKKGYFTIPVYPKEVKRYYPEKFEESHFPSKTVQPNVQTVYDRVTLEISRGCDEGCRFCQAGYIYRPARERKPEHLLNQAEKLLNNTGQDEVSLTSLSAANYPGIELLVEKLIKKYREKRISLSLPSLRADKYKEEFAVFIKEGRKTGFTIAPEAGTERLRKIINKNLKEEDILFAAKTAFENGWDHIKFYFMIGLPFEKEEDLRGMVELCEKALSFSKRGYVVLSASTFVPKPHTPFQWHGQINLEEIFEKQNFIKSIVRTRRIRYKFHQPEVSIIEGIISKGDRETAKVIEKAFKYGARFDGWSDTFDFSIWRKAIEESGIELEKYYKELSETTVFPWDFIDIGVRKNFLYKEYQNAKSETPTEMCVDVSSCNACGTCKGVYLKERFEKRTEFYKELKKEIEIERLKEKGKSEEQRHNYLVTFSKKGEIKFVSHLDLIRIIQRGLRISNQPIAFTKGFSPKPILTFSPALEVGVEGENELFVVETTKEIDEKEFIETVNRGLPPGIRIKSVRKIPFEKRKFLSSQCTLFYSIESETPLEPNENWENSTLIKKTKRGEKKIKLSDYILSVEKSENGYTIQSLFSPQQGSLKITEAAPFIFKNFNPDNVIIKRQKIEYGEI